LAKLLLLKYLYTCFKQWSIDRLLLTCYRSAIVTEAASCPSEESNRFSIIDLEAALVSSFCKLRAFLSVCLTVRALSKIILSWYELVFADKALFQGTKCFVMKARILNFN
jgi:hypothetical protein